MAIRGAKPKPMELRAITGNLGQRYLTFEYDDAGRLATVKQRDQSMDVEIVHYVYNSLGQRVEKHLASGDLIYYWYGLDGQLLAETDSGGATIIEYAYLNGAPLALLASDQDGDGVLDTDDNCITRQNSVPPNNQLDTNGDGFGNACDGDLNNDNLVDVADLVIMQNLINNSQFNANADLNGSGTVTNADKAILMSMFNQPPGPAGGGDGDALQKREYVLTDHRGAPFALSNNTR